MTSRIFGEINTRVRRIRELQAEGMGRPDVVKEVAKLDDQIAAYQGRLLQVPPDLDEELRRGLVPMFDEASARCAPPAAASSQLAVYNPAAFTGAQKRKAPGGRGGAAEQRDDAVRECRLAIHNGGCLYPRATAVPFKMPPKEWQHVDLEGDVLAACGERDFSNASESSENFVGHYRLPRDVDFRAEGGMLLGDMAYGVRQRAGRGIWYSRVLADAEHDMVWAAGEHGLILGFKGQEEAAVLQLPQEMLETRPALARVGGRLCCGGGDGKLRLWSVGAAVEDFRTRTEAAKEAVELLGKTGRAAEEILGSLREMGAADIRQIIQECRARRRVRLRFKQPDPRLRHQDGEGGGAQEAEQAESDDCCDEDDADESESEDDCPQLPKRGLSPTSQLTVLSNSAITDVQALSGSRVLVAFSDVSDSWGEERRGLRPRSSLRVFDADAARTVGVLAGHTTEPSMGRQLCAEQHLAFTVEERRGACKVWDLRTCAAVTTLSRVVGASKTELEGTWATVLGVPWASGSGGALAFTSGADECVRAWDLRAVRKEAMWTISTGNLVCRGLAWHEATQSLFATTHNPHMRTHGRYFGTYRYGKDVAEDAQQSEDDDGDDGRLRPCTWWPPRASHEREFFPARFNCSSPYMLRYVFGGPAHEEFKQWAVEAAEEQRELSRRRMEEFGRHMRAMRACSDSTPQRTSEQSAAPGLPSESGQKLPNPEKRSRG